jgi:flagellar biosynthesis GTPase FlhF
MPNLGQFVNSSDEQLMKDWDELNELWFEQETQQQKDDIYEYQRTIEDELNNREHYLDPNGIYWYC